MSVIKVRRKREYREQQYERRKGGKEGRRRVYCTVGGHMTLNGKRGSRVAVAGLWIEIRALLT